MFFSNPVSVPARLTSVRRKSPAPMRSTIESATCETISALANVLRPATETAPRPSLSAGVRSKRVVRNAGAIPNRRAAAREMRKVKPSTRASGATLKGKGSGPPETIARSISPAHDANKTPSAPPRNAISKLSVSIWRANRDLRAPRAMRTAISLCRAVPRASIRFAMLAHAMSSTSPTTTIRTCRGLEN